MSDAADDACIHLVKTLQRNPRVKQLEYVCLDCGRVHAYLPDDLVDQYGENQLYAWAARSNVPERQVERFIARADPRQADVRARGD